VTTAPFGSSVLTASWALRAPGADGAKLVVTSQLS